MRFCEECGAPLEDDAKFCEECGTPVEPLAADEDSPAVEETFSDEQPYVDYLKTLGEKQSDASTADKENTVVHSDELSVKNAVQPEKEQKPKEEKKAENQPADMKKDQAAIEVNMSVFSKEEELENTQSAYSQTENDSATQSSKSANATTGASSANRSADTGTVQSTNSTSQSVNTGAAQSTTSTSQSAGNGTSQSANSANSIGQSAGNGTAQSVNSINNPAGSGTIQNTESVSQTETAGKKKKGSALKIVLITVGIIIVIAAIAGAALYASGVIKVNSKPAVITPTPIPTQTPLENALDANNQAQAAPTEASTQEPVQTEDPLKALKDRWQHTFVMEDQYGSGELHIKVRSEEVVVITEIYYDYDGTETSRDKFTASFTSDKNNVIVDDYDSSTFYTASLSDDNSTISTVDEEGNAYGDFVKKGSKASNSASSGEYIIPDSSDRKLTKSDLDGLSSDQLRLARNEIYARHGRMFNDSELQSYFDAMSWYVPTTAPEDFNDQQELSKIERANIKLISKYE